MRDLEAAKKNLEIGEYHITAFLAQQAVEKALKALFIETKKETIQTHSLVYLGRELNLPKDLIKILRDLTPDFVISRYPDIAGEVPYELYDEDIAKEKIDGAAKVIEWVKKNL